MTATTHRRSSARPSRGQAMVEYLLVSMVVAAAVFVIVSPDIDLPVIWYFLDQLSVAMKRFLYAISTAT